MSLLGKENVDAYIIAIKSLFLYSGARPAVTVLSDGSLDNSDFQALRRHILGLRVITTDQVSVPNSCASTVEAWCRAYPYLFKLMYLTYIAQRPLVLFLDSDVVFRRVLPSNFLELEREVAVTYNCDHDHRRYDKHFHYLEEFASRRNLPLIPNLNCGLMLWRRDRIRPADAIQFLEYLMDKEGYLHGVAEQDAWTLLASSTVARALPADYLVLSNWEMNTSRQRRQAYSIHYVSGQRYVSMDYFRDALRVIRSLHHSKD